MQVGKFLHNSSVDLVAEQFFRYKPNRIPCSQKSDQRDRDQNENDISGNNFHRIGINDKGGGFVGKPN